MNLFNLKKTLTLAVIALTTVSASAQDLIASQAPSDKRMKDIRNLSISRSANPAADLANPAADIYSDWNNSYASSAPGHVPSNFRVDLRGFHMPTPSRTINSPFGPRWHRLHAGIDLKVYTGDTIRSAFDGKVRIVRNEGYRKGYGLFVVIRHPNGLETLYGHLSKFLVKEDQIVRAGEPIGLGGNTGRSSGSHLHFETRILGEPINPALMFDFVNQDVTADFYTVRQAKSKGSKSSSSKAIARQTTEEQTSQDFALVTDDAATLGNEQTANENVTTSNRKERQSAKSQRTSSYTIKNGDTLYKIAKQHGTTVSKLCKLNGLSEKSILHKGQTIKTS